MYGEKKTEVFFITHPGYTKIYAQKIHPSAKQKIPTFSSIPVHHILNWRGLEPTWGPRVVSANQRSDTKNLVLQKSTTRC